jgi:hypothetical protein
MRRCGVVGSLLAAALLAVAGGCGGRKAPTEGQGSKRKGPPTLPQFVTSSGIAVRWQEQGKGGRLQPILEVQAETGDLNAQTQSGRLLKTRGRFYNDGKPAARFQAPEVDADQDRHEVVARGGVTLVSIEPAGLTVTARNVVWDTVSGTILLRGDVRFVYVEPGGTVVTAAGGPFDRITMNAEMRRVTIP